jgi:hypothetical protein
MASLSFWGYLNYLLHFTTALPADPIAAVSPVLVEPPDHRKVYQSAWVGENILLPCVAQGYPVPEST